VRSSVFHAGLQPSQRYPTAVARQKPHDRGDHAARSRAATDRAAGQGRTRDTRHAYEADQKEAAGRSAIPKKEGLLLLQRYLCAGTAVLRVSSRDRISCPGATKPSGRFASGKPHGKFNAVDLVEDGGVRFVTPRFLRPRSPAKSGVRPWRRRKLVRKIFALPPSVALHDSDEWCGLLRATNQECRYHRWQKAVCEPNAPRRSSPFRIASDSRHAICPSLPLKAW
jgi:hypothetical protein